MVSNPSLAASKTSNRRSCPKKAKKPELEQLQIFWAAPTEAFFSQETISVVTNRSKKTLECDRWRGRGIPYRKTITGSVLYRKSDVVTWLESQQLVCSTSEYKQEVGNV